MHKNLFVPMFVLIIAVMALSACGPAATATVDVPMNTPVNTPVPAVDTPVPTMDPMSMYLPEAVSWGHYHSRIINCLPAFRTHETAFRRGRLYREPHH